MAACGLDGFYVRSAAGNWSRIGVPPAAATVDLATLPPLPALTGFGVIGLLLVAWLVFVAGTDAVAGADRTTVAASVAALALAVFATGFADRAPFDGLVWFALSATAVIAATFYLDRRRRQHALRWRLAACAVVTAIAAAAPALVLNRGPQLRYPPWWVEPLLAAFGVAVAVHIGLHLRQPAKPSTVDRD